MAGVSTYGQEEHQDDLNEMQRTDIERQKPRNVHNYSPNLHNLEYELRMAVIGEKLFSFFYLCCNVQI